MLCWLLLCNEVNQLYVYIYLSILNLRCYPHPSSYLSRSSQSTELSFPCFIAGFH